LVTDLPPKVRRLDLRQARRIAVRAQLLGDERADPAALGQPFDGRTALLSPFDRLIHDRARNQDLFGYEYLLEMYKPVDQRMWGYFALPILYQDRLIGKLDSLADRKAGTLRIHAIHQDVPFSKSMSKTVRAEVETFASWLGLGVAGIWPAT
jgi:uncharacterized protein YcaQ